MPRYATVTAPGIDRLFGGEAFGERVKTTLRKRVQPLSIGQQRGWREHPNGDQAL